eukprot:768394-Hanusia_phi.AAC.7
MSLACPRSHANLTGSSGRKKEEEEDASVWTETGMSYEQAMRQALAGAADSRVVAAIRRRAARELAKKRGGEERREERGERRGGEESLAAAAPFLSNLAAVLIDVARSEVSPAPPRLV